eukprot:15222545-Alexandrium_andersonii.AAC.1
MALGPPCSALSWTAALLALCLARLATGLPSHPQLAAMAPHATHLMCTGLNRLLQWTHTMGLL